MQHLLLAAPHAEDCMAARMFEAAGFRLMSCRAGAASNDSSPLRQRIDQLSASFYETLHSNWYHVTNIELCQLPIAVSDQQKTSQRDIISQLDKYQPWLWDHPDMCLLLPLWKSFLATPLCILYVEPPLSVAMSLQKTWRFPVVFGLALWEFYMRAAIANTQGLPRFVVSHEELIARPISYMDEIYRSLSEMGNQPLLTPNNKTINSIIAASMHQEKEPEQSDLGFVNREQWELYESLQNSDIERQELMDMSKTGEDILRAYGRLRMGFDSLRRHHEQSEVKIEGSFSESASVSDAIHGYPDKDAKSEYVEVTVYLHGMQPLELVCKGGNPVLGKLLDALIRKSNSQSRTEEIFHLQLGDQSFYFPISRLRGIETSDDTVNQAIEPDAEHDENRAMVATPAPAIITPVRARSVAIVVLGCMLPQYDLSLRTIRNTWGAQRVPNIDIYYIFGNQREDTHMENALGVNTPMYFAAPVPEFQARQFDDVIVCGCADTIDLQQDCLLRKRLIAFDYLAKNYNYDYIYSVCASSYVNQRALAQYIDSVDGQLLFHGPVGVCAYTDVPYVSGASTLFSIDIVNNLVSHSRQIIKENQSHYADDVAIGSWIARNVSIETEREIVNNIKYGRRATSDNTFVMPQAISMVDFVNKDTQHQLPLPGAYHYHFNVNTIGQMVAFHRQFV